MAGSAQKTFWCSVRAAKCQQPGMSTHLIHSSHDLILRYPSPPWWGYLSPSYRSTLMKRWAGSAGYCCVPLLMTHHSWAVLSLQLLQKTQLWVWISARTPEYSYIIKTSWIQTKSSFLCPAHKRRRGDDVLCTGCTNRAKSAWYPSRLQKAWRLWQIPQQWNLLLLSGYLYQWAS